MMNTALLLLAVLVACDTGDDGAPDAPVGPAPAGCITDTSAGDHVYMCSGLTVDARIPARCLQAGCGLILQLHGDTGDGPLMDAHTKMRDLGEQNGYIVLAPTGPDLIAVSGHTWFASNDSMLVEMTRQFATVFSVDPAKIHVTGFSRGAFVTWRLICNHSDLFVSAAPGGGGTNNNEMTCFTGGRTPARPIPILFLMGRTDASVGYATLTQIRDGVIANYAAGAPQVITSNASYSHSRWTGSSTIETFDHAYETVSNGPFANARGHCIPGSTSDPLAPAYAIPCQLPNAFVWGDEIMTFFLAHPR